MPTPTDVAIWRPRADEHALAASLGMCVEDPAILEETISAAQAEAAQMMPGVPVRVYRFHIWRVVRAMVRCRVQNTPAGRATAVGWLAKGGDEDDSR